MKKAPGYGDLPEEYSIYEKSAIVMIPVPYDETSTWIKGADKGPAALIRASWNMELFDIETGNEPYRKGIFTDKPVREKKYPETMVEAVRSRVHNHLKQEKFIVTIGGEHSVSIGAVYAHLDHFDDITVIQLDAHSDLRESYHGSRYNHACAMARIKERCPILQIGIRSMDSGELPNCDRNRIFFAENIHTDSAWILKAIDKVETSNCYITIDVDVFDISIMPSTGTPEPGGLLWYDVLNLLRTISEKKNIIGFDIVELCPNAMSRPYDFMTAKLIYKILSYVFTETRS